MGLMNYVPLVSYFCNPNNSDSPLKAAKELKQMTGKEIIILNSHWPRTVDEAIVNVGLMEELKGYFPEHHLTFAFLKLYLPLRDKIQNMGRETRSWGDVTTSPVSREVRKIMQLIWQPELSDSTYRRLSEMDMHVARELEEFAANRIDTPTLGRGVASLSETKRFFEYLLAHVKGPMEYTLLPNLKSWRNERILQALAEHGEGTFKCEGEKGQVFLKWAPLKATMSRSGLVSAQLQKKLVQQGRAAKVQIQELEQQIQQVKHANEELQAKMAQVQQEAHNWMARSTDFVNQIEAERMRLHADYSALLAIYAMESQQHLEEVQLLKERLARAEGKLMRTHQFESNGLFDTQSSLKPNEIADEFDRLKKDVRALVTEIVPNPAEPKGKEESLRKTINLTDQLCATGVASVTKKGAPARKKNKLVAAVQSIISELLFAALSGQVQIPPMDLTQLLASKITFGPQDSEEHQRTRRSDENFLRSLWKRVGEALEADRMPDKFTNPLDKLFLKKSSQLDAVLRERVLGEITETYQKSLFSRYQVILRSCLKLRCRARAVGMNFYFDPPRSPAVKVYEKILQDMQLDGERFTQLKETLMGGRFVNFDPIRMQTRCPTGGNVLYRFSIFPGMTTESQVAVRADVWCE